MKKKYNTCLFPGCITPISKANLRLKDGSDKHLCFCHQSLTETNNIARKGRHFFHLAITGALAKKHLSKAQLKKITRPEQEEQNP